MDRKMRKAKTLSMFLVVLLVLTIIPLSAYATTDDTTQVPPAVEGVEGAEGIDDAEGADDADGAEGVAPADPGDTAQNDTQQQATIGLDLTDYVTITNAKLTSGGSEVAGTGAEFKGASYQLNVTWKLDEAVKGNLKNGSYFDVYVESTSDTSENWFGYNMVTYGWPNGYDGKITVDQSTTNTNCIVHRVTFTKCNDDILSGTSTLGFSNYHTTQGIDDVTWSTGIVGKEEGASWQGSIADPSTLPGAVTYTLRFDGPASAGQYEYQAESSGQPARLSWPDGVRKFKNGAGCVEIPVMFTQAGTYYYSFGQVPVMDASGKDTGYTAAVVVEEVSGVLTVTGITYRNSYGASDMLFNDIVPTFGGGGGSESYPDWGTPDNEKPTETVPVETIPDDTLSPQTGQSDSIALIALLGAAALMVVRLAYTAQKQN